MIARPTSKIRNSNLPRSLPNAPPPTKPCKRPSSSVLCVLLLLSLRERVSYTLVPPSSPNVSLACPRRPASHDLTRAHLTSPTDHFDTAQYVQRLEREGLSRRQAEGVIDTLEEVIEESIRNMQANLVTRAEQDKVRCAAALTRGEGEWRS